MSNSVGEMPLFAKTMDFLAWMAAQVENFPKLYRDTITRRTLDALLDFQEAILTANNERNQQRLAHLQQADGHLDKVRLYMRLIHRVRWLNDGQYEHGSRMLVEIGKLLGGWRRATENAIQKR